MVAVPAALRRRNSAARQDQSEWNSPRLAEELPRSDRCKRTREFGAVLGGSQGEQTLNVAAGAAV